MHLSVTVCIRLCRTIPRIAVMSLLIGTLCMPSTELNNRLQTTLMCFDAVVMGLRDKLPAHTSRSRYRKKRYQWTLQTVYLILAADPLYHSLVARCYGNCCCNSRCAHCLQRPFLKQSTNSDINRFSHPAASLISHFYVLALICPGNATLFHKRPPFRLSALVV